MNSLRASFAEQLREQKRNAEVEIALLRSRIEHIEVELERIDAANAALETSRA